MYDLHPREWGRTCAAAKSDEMGGAMTFAKRRLPLWKWLYPHHANPRDLGLYPWLEVLKDTERGFVCACCGVKQHWFRPMVFMPDVGSLGPQRFWARARFICPIVPWCVSCAWALCGRQMVRARRWYQFWR